MIKLMNLEQYGIGVVKTVLNFGPLPASVSYKTLSYKKNKCMPEGKVKNLEKAQNLSLKINFLNIS